MACCLCRTLRHRASDIFVDVRTAAGQGDSCLFHIAWFRSWNVRAIEEQERLGQLTAARLKAGFAMRGVGRGQRVYGGVSSELSMAKVEKTRARI